MSIMLITHDLGVVAETCDDVAVMYGGRVVERGSVEDVFGSPQHPYTEALLQSIPMLGMTQAEPLRVIRGNVPSPLNWPKGCRFAPRCDYAFDRCQRGAAAALPRGAQESACFLCEHGRRETCRRPRRPPRDGRSGGARGGRRDRATCWSRRAGSRSTSRSRRACSARRSRTSRRSTASTSPCAAARRSASSASRAAASRRSAGRSCGCSSRPDGEVYFEGIDLTTLSRARAQGEAPRHADHLPGLRRLARPAHADPQARRRGARDPRRAARASGRRAWSRCSTASASGPTR